MSLMVLDGYHLAEVAKNFKVTPPCAENIVKRFFQRILPEEEAIKFLPAVTAATCYRIKLYQKIIDDHKRTK